MEILSQILNEIIVIALLFALILVYASYRSKKDTSQESPLKYHEILRDIASIFGVKSDVEGLNFAEFLDTLVKFSGGKVVKFAKHDTQNDFINGINRQNFKAKFLEQNFTDKTINKEFIIQSAANLNENLALGLYILDDTFYAFLCEKDELIRLIELAATVGENIIICD